MGKKPPLYESVDWPHFIIQSMADGVITVDGKLRLLILTGPENSSSVIPGRRPWGNSAEIS